jgi:squalene cyclase
MTLLTEIESAFQRARTWAWSIRNSDNGWGRAKGAASTFSDSAELVYGLIKAGEDPNSKRMVESIEFSRGKYISPDRRHPPYADWTAKPHAFKYHMFVAMMLLEANYPKDDEALLFARKALKAHKNGEGWCSDREANETNVYDTVYALEVLEKLGESQGEVKEARAWLSSIQNHDGGWGFVRGERSNPACTGLALMALNREHPDAANRGVEWLRRKQLEEGRWRITYELGMGHADAYLYNSTGYALRGLMRAGEDPQSETVQKAVRYSLDVQSKEGGWYLVGEEKIMPPCEKLQALVYITAQGIAGLKEYVLHAQ